MTGPPEEVLLVGESVAAGYLLAPALTPAISLQHVLDVAGVPGSVRVLDLARVDDTLPGIVGVLESWRTAHPSRRPAAVIVMAGNNWRLRHLPGWSPRYPRDGLRAEMAGILGDGGVAALAREVDQLGAVGASRGLAALGAAAEGVPVLLVIPPVELATWEQRQPTPWLPDDGVASWYAELARGLHALATGDLPGAAAAAAAMDARSEHPVPHHLHARILRAQGQEADAREAARRALDADAYPLMATLSAPRATTLDVLVMQDAARRHGFDVLDLPTLLSAVDPDMEPAGRRHLLDYCHLTPRGVHIAAAGMARWVLDRRGVHGSVAADVGRLAAIPPVELSRADHATSLIGTAVHRAHRHLPLPGTSEASGKRADLAWWLERALDIDPSAGSALGDLVAMRRDVLPAPLTAAGLRNAGSAHTITPAQGVRWAHADADLVQAAIGVLDLDPRSGLVEDAATVPVDLLAGRRHLWEPLAQPLEDHADLPDTTRRGYLDVLWPHVDLHLPIRRPAPLRLTVTARLAAQPWTRQPGLLLVEVNGRPLGKVAPGRRWTRHVVQIPAGALVPGANRVRLLWPMIHQAGPRPLSHAIQELRADRPVSLHPIFGQLLAATAAPAAPAAPADGRPGA